MVKAVYVGVGVRGWRLNPQILTQVAILSVLFLVLGWFAQCTVFWVKWKTMALWDQEVASLIPGLSSS